MKTKPEKPKQRSRYQQCLPVEMNFHEQKQTPEHTRARSIHRRRHRFLDSGFYRITCAWFIYELHLNWRIWCNEFERKKEERRQKLVEQNQNKFFWIVADVDVKFVLVWFVASFFFVDCLEFTCAFRFHTNKHRENSRLFGPVQFDSAGFSILDPPNWRMVHFVSW